MSDDGGDLISQFGSRESHARDRRLRIARDAFVTWLAWQYRDQPGDPAWDLTELVRPWTSRDCAIATERRLLDAQSQVRRSAPVPPVEPTAARRPETPIRAAGTNRWDTERFAEFDWAIDDYIKTPINTDQRVAVQRVVNEGLALLRQLGPPL